MRKIIGEKLKRGKVDIFISQGNFERDDVEAFK